MSRRPALARLAAILLCSATALPLMGFATPATVLERIPGPDGTWDYLSFDPGRHRIYVSRGYGVMVIDTRTGKAIDQFAKGSRTHSIVVVPGSDVLVVTNSGDNTARIIDAAGGDELASIPAGKGADAAAYDPATGLVWVMNHSDGTITIVDPEKRAAVGVVDVGGILEFTVVDGAGRLYVNVVDRHEIAVVDTRARKVVARYKLQDCIEPSGVALTDKGLLIAACEENAVFVRALDGEMLGAVKIGPSNDTVTYDPVRQRVYIPTGGDGKLTVLDVRGPLPVLVGTVDIQAGSRKSGVDPTTGKIYLPVAGFEPEPGADGRPVMLPGTFEVWVLKPPE